jgi:hypothetical protein
MSLPVEFLSGADADLQGIFNRLEDYRDDFAVEFMMAVDAYLSRIAVFPESAPLYSEKVRRQVMRGFPFGFSTSLTQPGFSWPQSSICARIQKIFAAG